MIGVVELHVSLLRCGPIVLVAWLVAGGVIIFRIYQMLGNPPLLPKRPVIGICITSIPDVARPV